MKRILVLLSILMITTLFSCASEEPCVIPVDTDLIWINMNGYPLVLTAIDTYEFTIITPIPKTMKKPLEKHGWSDTEWSNTRYGKFTSEGETVYVLVAAQFLINCKEN